MIDNVVDEGRVLGLAEGRHEPLHHAWHRGDARSFGKERERHSGKRNLVFSDEQPQRDGVRVRALIGHLDLELERVVPKRTNHRAAHCLVPNITQYAPHCGAQVETPTPTTFMPSEATWASEPSFGLYWVTTVGPPIPLSVKR